MKWLFLWILVITPASLAFLRPFIDRPYVVPKLEKEGHSYYIPIDNDGKRKYIFKVISIDFHDGDAFFGEFDFSDNCGQFVYKNEYRRECKPLLFLLHSDFNEYHRVALFDYMKNKTVCAHPVKLERSFLILDKPDRSSFSNPKYIGTYNEAEQAVTYLTSQGVVTIDAIPLKLASGTVARDRIEILCRVSKEIYTRR